ncbi:hypothetical protein BHAOGJBA_0758 [Methylobacterium hispanicum]|uniref:Uncharacterized protein n=1 Tax=Methylobacterium hispanicum TaxID=270350 RepID=A0AAV4ZH67_9HYPH|nr:hypothetical protein [Methylobacterium hispanicum]GJD87258.1 hypothetical protein BHAOGJBA_0758 [Methylobacterium hispanicum]
MTFKFRVEIAADVAPSIEAWRDRFVSTVGIAKYRRAAGWAVDEVAKHAVLGIREQFHKHLKSNTPWTQSAIKYQRSTAGGLNAIEQGKADGLFSAVYVMPKQSTYLKYLFGLQDNTRLPGDVGLAQRHLLIPWWDNIKLTQGVQPTRFGGVPTGFLARLAREAQGTKAPKRSGTSSRWGVYFGEITLHGQKRLAYVARPPRVATSESMYIPGRDGGMRLVGRRMRDIDHPRVLFLAVDRATYKPILEQPWQEACEAAAARIPQIVAEQLADNLFHAAKMAAAGARQP